MHSKSLLVPVLLAACAHEPSPSVAADTTAQAQASTSTGEADDTVSAQSTGEAYASSGGDVSALPLALDRAWVESLAGPWQGPVRDTPLGDLSQFYWAFAWTEQDVMRAVADNGMGFRFVFELTEEDGTWALTETGTLPGGMTQSYELHPVERDGDRVRFELLDRPDFLQLDIEPSAEAFFMDVRLRGEPHGTFELARPR